jgi:hypothetical protein
MENKRPDNKYTNIRRLPTLETIEYVLLLDIK